MGMKRFSKMKSLGKTISALLLELPTLRFILTGYIENALSQAKYDKLEDGSFSGRIPSCTGVIAFGKTLRECEDDLRSTLEDWVLAGLKSGHPIPFDHPLKS